MRIDTRLARNRQINLGGVRLLTDRIHEHHEGWGLQTSYVITHIVASWAGRTANTCRHGTAYSTWPSETRPAPPRRLGTPYNEQSITRPILRLNQFFIDFSRQPATDLLIIAVTCSALPIVSCFSFRSLRGSICGWSTREHAVSDLPTSMI